MSNLPRKRVTQPQIPNVVTQDRLARTKVVDFTNMYDYAGSAGFIPRYPSYDPFANNEFKYEEAQSGWEKAANGVKQFGVLAKSTFLNQASQTFNNLFSSGITWDNTYQHQIAGDIMAAQNRNPIYQSKEAYDYEQQNKGLAATLNKYNPLGSPDFVGYWSQLGGQFGFAAGTIVYAALEGLLLSRLSPNLSATTIPKSLKNLYKGLYSFKNFNQARNAVARMNKTKNLVKQVGQFGAYTARMANLATGEASIESNIAANEFFYDQFLKLGGGEGVVDAAKLSEVQDAAQKVGNTTFGLNVGILTVSNFITIGNVLKPSFLTKDALKTATKELAKKEGKYFTQKELANTFLKKAGYYGKKAAKAPLTNINEGFEELAQGLASRTSQRYYDIVESDIGKSNLSFMEELGREVTHTFETGEGWDEFISGLFIGTGMALGRSGFEKATGQTKKQYQQQELARDLLNQSKEEFTDAFINSRTFSDLNNQTAIALESSGQVQEGNQKAIKDLRTEARNSMFEKMYQTGVGEEHIDFVFEGIESLEQDNEQAAKDSFGDRSILAEKEDMKRQYKEWVKTADQNFTAFDNGQYGDKKLAFERAVFDLTNMESHLQDTITRVDHIQADLADMHSSSPMATQLNELMDMLAHPEKLDKTITQQQELINTKRESLNTVDFSAEERKLREDELAQEQQYLDILKETQKTLLDENGNPKASFEADKAITKLVESFNELDQSAFNARVQPLMRDTVELSRDASGLQKVMNILSNQRYFDKYAEAHHLVQQAYRNKIMNRFKVARNEATPEEVKPEVEVAAEKTEAPSEDLQTAKDELEKINYEEGKFEYEGEVYDTFEEAFNAAAKNLPQSIRSRKELMDSLKKEFTKSNTTNTTTPTSTTTQSVVPSKVEEQWKKDQDIDKVPDDTLEAIYQKPLDQRTEVEKQMVVKDMDRGKESYMRRRLNKMSKKSEEKDNKPKTKEDISNEEKSARPESRNSTLAHFFSMAHGVVNTIKQYLSKNNKVNLDPKVFKVLEPLRTKNSKSKYSIVTIHMNDTIISDGVRDVKDVTTEQILQDIEENDSSVIRDSRGRLVIVMPTKNLSQSKQKLADLYGLYIDANDYGKISSLRIRSEDGDLVASNFDQDIFGEESVRELNKIKRRDRIKVVIPNNEFNKKLVKQFERELLKLKNPTQQDVENLFKSIVADELVLDFMSNNKVVGRMRSGSYFVGDSKVSQKVTAFRQDILTLNAFIEFAQEDKPSEIGSVEVDTTSTERNVVRDAEGNPIFTTLEEYEKSIKDNPDLNHTIEYFVATSRRTMEDADGKRVGTTEINRKSPLRKGAVYVRITDPKTGEYIVVQAAREDARTYTPSDLKENTFKQELEVSLKAGEKPVVSKRLYIDSSSFNDYTWQVNHTETILPRLKQVEGGSATLTVYKKDNSKEYENIQVDEETQTVTAEHNGQQEEIPFSEIIEVESQDEAEVQEEVTPVAYEDVSPLLKEQWIVTNGEAGQTYTLPDGTKIKVLARDGGKVTLSRGGHQIVIGEEDSIDFTQMRDQIAGEQITDSELYQILKTPENELNLRQKVIKIFHSGRLSSLAGKIKASIKKQQRNLPDFIAQSTIDMLEVMLEGGLDGTIWKLIEVYRQGVINKNTPESMEELLDRANIPEDQRQILRDMMSYMEFANFFAYISQADTIYGFQRMGVVRYSLQSNVPKLKNWLNFIESMDFDSTPDERTLEILKDMYADIIEMFGSNSIFIEGIGKIPEGGYLYFGNKDENIMLLNALITLMDRSYNRASVKDVARRFIEANDALAPLSVKIHLDSLFTTELAEQRRGLGRDVVLNDVETFLEEFDDLVLAEKASNPNRTKILVKDEQGLTQEVDKSELDNLNTEKVESAISLINEELSPYGQEINREYVAAYLKVNESIQPMYERIISRKIDLEEAMDYSKNVFNREQPTTVKTEYFNKTKAAKQAESNMC